jgi:hypothetical protein
MSNEAYPFDPEVRRRVTELLYELLPSLYRVHDEPPNGQGHLRAFLSILAAPLAEVRQSIEELHADLFIDTSSDPVLPYLAEMVGTTLVFPDAASNRRDVRSTARWRRRKGTPAMLEELGSELFNRIVVTQEGWRRLQMTQEVNLPRPERAVPDVRSPLLPETSSGPLDSLFHAVDVRPGSERGGRYHPRQIVHWTYPTESFPVRQATAYEVPGALEPLHAFHPRGLTLPLRLQRASPEEPVRTDRVPAVSFAQAPEDFFGREGGFTVRICGLAAAVGREQAPARRASTRSADPELVEGWVRASLLAPLARGLTGPMRVELFAVPLTAAGEPRPEQAALRGGLALTPASSQEIVPELLPVSEPHVAMLRLSTPAAGTHGFFPGAVLELASQGDAALRASRDAGLAVEGFLRGALILRLPSMWLEGEQWLYVAADGSVYDAGRAGRWVPVQPVGGRYELEGQALSVGPGSAWPPAPYSATDERMTRLPSSPVRGPVLMHGGAVLLDGQANPAEFSLVFAARYVESRGVRYQPFLQLSWSLMGWRWSALRLAEDGTPQEAPILERFQEIAALRDTAPGQLQLVVRLEAAEAGLVLTPCEVAWPADGGEAVLLHLPEMITRTTESTGWRSGGLAAGPVVFIGSDGSTKVEGEGTTRVARYALGSTAVAPLQGARTLRRRQLRGRELALPGVGGPPPSEDRRGFLDIDPVRGLFALDAQELPVLYPPWRGQPHLSPSSVTVDYQEGSSSHIGARSAPREPTLGERQPKPTRLVASRALSDSTTERLSLPIHPSLTEALRAIAEDPAPAEHEVIQFEDSSTYLEDPVWPPTVEPVPEPGVLAVRARGPRRLTIQAAEAQRPVLRVWSWGSVGQAWYERITLRGLSVGGSPITFPEADEVILQFCTVARAEDTLSFGSGSGQTRVQVSHCMTSELVLQGKGSIAITDSIVHGAPRGLHVPDGTCRLERVTVLGDSAVHILDASESILDGALEVRDRFRGCVRYSRVPSGTPLPVTHQAVKDVPVRFVTRDRDDPAYARLAADCDLRIARGAEDGSEMGAFHGARLVQRYEALSRRLSEYTPAGLVTGICRLD